MTGTVESVLGVEPEPVLRKFLTQMPVRFEVAQKGPVQFNAVIVDVCEETGLAREITRFADLHEF
jgi:calcineurin-like phosphoesterase